MCNFRKKIGSIDYNRGLPPRTIIGTSTTFTGDVISEGDFRIDGEFNGSLIIKGELILGQSGIITGIIKAKKAELYGKIKANMEFEEIVILRSTSEIQGDIITKNILIEDGCIFNGQCNMISNIVE